MGSATYPALEFAENNLKEQTNKIKSLEIEKKIVNGK